MKPTLHSTFRRLTLSAILVQVFSGTGWTESLPVPSAEQTKWPKELVVTVGDIRTRISGSKMWTLSGIDFQNTVMATENSAYGTVLTIRGVGHLGTAHFLDVPGKPGQVEKEIVTSLGLFLNGIPVTDFSPDMNLTGTTFRMERTSKIRDVNLESLIEIRDDTLIETARLRATETVDLQTAFPLMYAWTAEATDYLFGNGDGILRRGGFLKTGETASELIKEACWVAVFSSASGKGSVAYLAQSPLDPKSTFFLVDAPGVYRKTALHSFGDTIMPKGFDGTYQVAVGFFMASERDWEKQALARLSALRDVLDQSNISSPTPRQ